jgi:hypothetical protein
VVEDLGRALKRLGADEGKELPVLIRCCAVFKQAHGHERAHRRARRRVSAGREARAHQILQRRCRRKCRAAARTRMMRPWFPRGEKI